MTVCPLFEKTASPGELRIAELNSLPTELPDIMPDRLLAMI